MDQIKYAGNTLVTGSDIAHAVLAYAQALASSDDSATIGIPVQHDDGSIVTAELLIGPASQLIAEPFETAADEIEDEDVVRRLNDATSKLQTPHAVTENATDLSALDASELDRAARLLED
jgi:hypothetical protein